jgi:hypothetical protein
MEVAMKKIICLFFAFACVLILSSCEGVPAQTPSIPEPPADSLYTLMPEQNSLYLIPKNEIMSDMTNSSPDGTSETVNGGGQLESEDDPKPLKFSSVSEIKNKILNYELTREEVMLLAALEQDAEGRISLWNVSRACEPALPEGVSYSRGELYGSYFRLLLETADGAEGFYGNVAPDDYQETLGYERLLTDESMRVYQTEDRNATVIENEGLFGLVRRYLYEISDDPFTYMVGEMYYDVENNSTVPDSVYVYIETDYECYYVEWYGLTERPSVEWLTYIGVAHTE